MLFFSPGVCSLNCGPGSRSWSTQGSFCEHRRPLGPPGLSQRPSTCVLPRPPQISLFNSFPDLCSMHWQGSEQRSVVPSCDVRAHRRTHFASATFSSSHYCDDFFASVSRHSRMTTAIAGSTLHSLTTNWSQRLLGFTNLRQVLLGWPVLF